MSAEAGALRVLRASLDRSVAMWVLLWTSYHCHIDRLTKMLEESDPHVFASVPGPVGPAVVSQAVMKGEINRLMKRSAPKGFYEQTKTSQDNPTREGVPLWSWFLRLVVQSNLFYLKDTQSERVWACLSMFERVWAYFRR